MELEGKIIMELPLEEGISKAGNPWKKKGWVLETFGMYPRKVKFDLFGDRVDNIRFEVMKDYVVSVDAESREFNGRWYTDLRAFSARPFEAPQGGNYPNQGGNYPQGGQPQGGNQQYQQPAPQYGAPQFGNAPQPDYATGVAPQPQMPDIPQGSSDEELPF